MLTRRLLSPRARVHGHARSASFGAALLLAACADGSHPESEPLDGQARALEAPPAWESAHDHADPHCTRGEPPDPAAAQLADRPVEWRSPRSGAVDLVLPKEVLAWMGARTWEASHDAWHNVRRCRLGFGRGANALCSRRELVPADQECANAEDGYQFLVMHRHMMQALRQAFPTTPDLFAGFPAFPFDAEDVPAAWRGRFGSGWSSTIRQTAAVLEDIEHQLDRFPTEGDLGRTIQCGTSGGASSIHGALHFKWVVNDSPHSLGKQTVNIDNYMFWKLHGWIDRIWERYRAAKGLPPDEPKLRDALVAQCREMHALGRAVRGEPPAPPRPGDRLPPERGAFHQTVRPILEKHCSGCHSEASPEGMLSLGGQLSSREVVQNLVGVPAVRGGQFLRVVPGAPERSWLYLKVSGLAAGAGCSGECNPSVMPPTGAVTLSASELETLRTWIAAGAPAPPD